MHTMSFLEDIFSGNNKPNHIQPQYGYPNANLFPNNQSNQNQVQPTNYQPLPQQLNVTRQPTNQPTSIYFTQPTQPIEINQNQIYPNQLQQQNKPETFSRLGVAKMIYEEKKMEKIDAMVGIAAGIIPIIMSIFWGILGLFVGVILSAYFIYRFIMQNKEINYLKQTYGL